ncbi:MAG: ABC transporter ATP-binding protein [Actinobacteria bacterium]|nr:ABC transporter ATP-binding protein [Actinomycetota bacterium]
MEQPTAIEARGASRRYGSIQALDNVTLTIDAPATGLLGQNGAGKSTLMKAILGLVRLDAGEIDVLGHNARRDGEQVRRRIGYAPEHECLPPELTAADLCRHLAELRGLSRADAIRRASEVLFAVGLEEERSRVIGGFSLGMRQRVKLAQALVHAPDLIILDEPTNGLDPAQRAEMLDVIRRVSRDLNVRVLISSHILDDIRRTCDAVVVMRDGAVTLARPLAAEADEADVLLDETVADSAPFVAGLTAAGLDCTVLDATTTRVAIRSEGDRDVLRDIAASTGVGLRRLHRDGPSIEDELLEAIG